MRIVILAVAFVLASCSCGSIVRKQGTINVTQGPNIRSGTIRIWGTREYDRYSANLKVPLSEARKLSAKANNGFPFGDQVYFLLDEWYLFSLVSEDKSGVMLAGTYVNGVSGKVVEVTDAPDFNKSDPRWKVSYSIWGLKPAPSDN